MNRTIHKKRLREFGFLFGFGLPILIGWILPVLSGHTFRIWTIWVGIPSILIGIFMPSVLLYPYKGWMAIGHGLGFINSHLILGLIFLVVLQPIAYVMRALGYDPLRKKKSNVSSYREIKNHVDIDLRRIF
ncbi:MULTISPECIES: SxtJ family membrane protein [unclassified Prochlorococcus]|uniref:SxtJ family membrane protein n=1 Tax=unclassified Prochlorococcus TaxID=2627481 RepID=UPI0005337ECE|nr:MULTISPECIES: SxtJ family membrane protein [unclassified Prochlorococcus]KGG15621.1 hypothetical protein EV07_1586 [Prochlorococcus sp. MIT 0603]